LKLLQGAKHCRGGWGRGGVKTTENKNILTRSEHVYIKTLLIFNVLSYKSRKRNLFSYCFHL